MVRRGVLVVLQACLRDPLSTPGTDNALVTLEHASDDELHSVGHQHLCIRQAAIDDEASSRSDDVG